MSGKTFTVRRGTTAIPNQTIYATYEALADKDGVAQSLSIQALGLLLLALSRPTGKASQGYRALLGRGMGRDALLKAQRELEAVGHRYQFKRRSPGGSIITDTVVSEVPITPEEAEEEWLAQVRQLNGKPVDEPVDNPDSHRAPEIGATGPAGTGTVRRFTVARSPGASSVPEAKSLKDASLLETEIPTREVETLPAPGGTESVDDAATLGPGRAEVLRLLAEKRAKAQGSPVGHQASKEVASLQHLREQAGTPDTPGEPMRWEA